MNICQGPSRFAALSLLLHSQVTMSTQTLTFLMTASVRSFLAFSLEKRRHLSCGVHITEQPTCICHDMYFCSDWVSFGTLNLLAISGGSAWQRAECTQSSPGAIEDMFGAGARIRSRSSSLSSGARTLVIASSRAKPLRAVA
ncbi:hypothetical protein HD553DRAFT_307656 [Filobasidium floriforme]|uniref:uncharacterized protein n=1 Tax=Filobasidium floriforme TaxID=5210 RepID=UPI001E8DEE3D|nr:uncharacterized protein HD553DRAFT_307656 [Filobasidium floriforme]KAH8088225.1 hypothetical protein HD553DRAFT_307656 [Filobasidium floriforme]